MNGAILCGLVVNLLVLVANVGACFYWFGFIRAKLDALEEHLALTRTTLYTMDQRLRTVELDGS